MSRAARILSDRHVLIILRSLLNGPKTYGEIKSALGGDSDATLSARLKAMVDDRLLCREEEGRLVRYLLSDRGADTCSIFVALWQWERDWLGRPNLLIHGRCNAVTDAVLSCSVCRDPFDRPDAMLVLGPGAGFEVRSPSRQRRKSIVESDVADPAISPVAIEAVGNFWSVSILAGIFGRCRTFGDLSAALGIPSAVLTGRLQALVRTGILERISDDSNLSRQGYQLTAAGAALYPLTSMFLRWGDRWTADAAGPPMLHRHRGCGQLFDPTLLCAECGTEFHAGDVTFARVV